MAPPPMRPSPITPTELTPGDFSCRIGLAPVPLEALTGVGVGAEGSGAIRTAGRSPRRRPSSRSSGTRRCSSRAGSAATTSSRRVDGCSRRRVGAGRDRDRQRLDARGARGRGGVRRIEPGYPGRFQLGIGISHAPLVDRDEPGRYSRPLGTMRKYLDGLDGAAPVPRADADRGPRAEDARPRARAGARGRTRTSSPSSTPGGRASGWGPA